MHYITDKAHGVFRKAESRLALTEQVLRDEDLVVENT